MGFLLPIMNSAGGGASSLVTAAADGVKSDITAVLPAIGGVFAVIVGVVVAVKLFKRVAGS